MISPNLQVPFFVSYLLSMAISASWVSGEDWKLTFDQLSNHERSFRIVVNARGEIVALTKKPKDKDFEKSSQSRMENDAMEELRGKVIELQQILLTAKLSKRSAKDVDIRYRVIYEHDGAEIEARWMAGQIGSSKEASEAYLAILEMLRVASGMDISLKPDPFLKETKRETFERESR